jgi:hypothetical protein
VCTRADTLSLILLLYLDDNVPFCPR